VADRSVAELLDEAAELPPGFVRTSLVERAVDLADASGDLDAAFAAREALLVATEHGGEPDKALVTAIWLLGQIDAHPGRFDVRQTYWALKWLPLTLARSAGASLQQIDGVVDEAARRYASEGAGQDAVAKLRWMVALQTGDLAIARAAQRRWVVLPRTAYADCRACDAADQASLALAVGELDLAEGVAEAVLSGRLSCAEQPQLAAAEMLAPLRRAGRLDRAEQLHRRYVEVTSGPGMADATARHASYLAATGRTGDAVALLAPVLGMLDRVGSDRVRLTVLAAAGGVAAAAHAAGTPDLVPPWPQLPLSAEAAVQVLARQARALAARFDERNGTPVVGHDTELLLDLGAVASTAPAATEAVAVGETGPRELLRRARVRRPVAVQRRRELAEQASALALDRGDRATWALAERTLAATDGLTGDADRERQRLLETYEALAGDEALHEQRGLCALALRGEALKRGEHDVAEGWRAAALENAGPRVRAAVAAAEAGAAQRDGDLDGARAAAVAGLAVSAEHDDRLLTHDLLVGLARTTARAGDLPGARDHALAAAALSQEVDDPDSAMLLAQLHADLGEDERASLVLAAVLERTRSVDRPMAAQAADLRAAVLARSGMLEEALAATHDAYEAFAAEGDLSSAGWRRLDLARLHQQLGNDQTAYDTLDDVLSGAQDRGESLLSVAVLLDMAMMDLRYGYAEDALRFAERALPLVPKDRPEDHARVLQVLADAEVAAGRGSEALAHGEQALGLWESAGAGDALLDGLHAQARRALRADLPDQALATARRLQDKADVGERAAHVRASAELLQLEALEALGRTDEAVRLADAVAQDLTDAGKEGLRGQALWALARLRGHDAATYDEALAAWASTGASPAWLAERRDERDELVNAPD
jgi:tetratricopeptide (TPR) repeat protein